MRNRKWSNVLKSIDKMTVIAKEVFGEDCLIIDSNVKESQIMMSKRHQPVYGI